MYNPSCTRCRSARNAGYPACSVHRTGSSQPMVRRGYGYTDPLLVVEEAIVAEEVAEFVEDIVEDVFDGGNDFGGGDWG